MAYAANLMEPKVVLDLHGTRAQVGVDIDAFEVFLRHFRAALREYDRSMRGPLARRGGHPDARDLAASSFRLIGFQVGSGIATLTPARPTESEDANLPLDDSGDDLSMSTLMGLVSAIESDAGLPGPVVEALDSARRSIGEDGCFGVDVAGPAEGHKRIVIDDALMKRLRDAPPDSSDSSVVIIGRLHMIEVDQPGRRVGIRAQDGIDWTCQYPDELHDLVTSQLERLVRAEGTGRKLSKLAGRLVVEHLEPLPEHVQDPLFSDEPIPLEDLREAQGIADPQGVPTLLDGEWDDDDASRRFLEATLGAAADQ
jgi:hypothetical protein